MTDRLTEAADAVLAAVRVPGPRPDVHRAQMERLRREWPALWNALGELALTRRAMTNYPNPEAELADRYERENHR